MPKELWFRWSKYEWSKWPSLHYFCSSVAVANRLEVRPLPGLPVIKDLIVDMKPFYDQYEKIKPFLDNDEEINTGHERLQVQTKEKS